MNTELDESDSAVFRLPCAICDATGLDPAVRVNGDRDPCWGCDDGWVNIRITDAVVEGVIRADGKSGPWATSWVGQTKAVRRWLTAALTAAGAA